MSTIASSKYRHSIQKIGVTKTKKLVAEVAGTSGKGYKRIGSGSYATVFAKSRSNEVIKVGTDVDDAWIKYAVTLVSNKKKYSKNPYLPKVKSIKFYERQGSWFFYVAKIEKLKDLDTVARRAYSVAEIVEQMTENLTDIDLGLFANKNLVSAIKLIKDLGCDTDLHSGNIMVRGKNQLVFTDPVQ